jgi:hypothetical protein
MTASAGGTNPERETEAPDTTPDELRRTARFVEAVGLDAVAQFSELAFPLAVGGVKDFPRPSPEDRAALPWAPPRARRRSARSSLEGIERLRARLEDAVAELHALASALEADLEVPAVALIPARPYLDAYRAAAPEEQPYLIKAPNEGVEDDSSRL